MFHALETKLFDLRNVYWEERSWDALVERFGSDDAIPQPVLEVEENWGGTMLVFPDRSVVFNGFAVRPLPAQDAHEDDVVVAWTDLRDPIDVSTLNGEVRDYWDGQSTERLREPTATTYLSFLLWRALLAYEFSFPSRVHRKGKAEISLTEATRQFGPLVPLPQFSDMDTDILMGKEVLVLRPVRRTDAEDDVAIVMKLRVDLRYTLGG